MSRLVRQASSGRASQDWHRINWVACHRRVRSLQRRIVQAAQPGAWRKVKRLSSLLVHSCAARALAVKRVTEHTGKKTPGVDGDRWTPPAKNAPAVLTQISDGFQAMWDTYEKIWNTANVER